MKLYCVGCQKDVDSRLTDGREIYPHRPDLALLPFWKCDTCGNYVGCHHKTANRTRPLGNIPTPSLRAARQQLHALLDPLWKSRRYSRKSIYAQISTRIGRPFHTAETKDISEILEVEKVVTELVGKGD